MTCVHQKRCGCAARSWRSQLADSATRIATVFFGANDASLKEVNPRQHVPLEEYVSNLRKIVAHLKEHTGAQLILICPPPAVMAGESILWLVRLDPPAKLLVNGAYLGG